MFDGTVAISHRTEEHGILTSAWIGRILGALHTKPQKRCERQCVAKQCQGVYVSFVTDVHPKLCDRVARKFCNLTDMGVSHGGRLTYAARFFGALEHRAG